MIYKFKNSAYSAISDSRCACCGSVLIGTDIGGGMIEVRCASDDNHVGIVDKQTAKRLEGMDQQQRIINLLGF